jgi:hypothetical protein
MAATKTMNPHEPTDENRRLISTLCGIGVPQKMIAAQIGIDEKTLKKYYDDDMSKGRAKATSQIAKRLYDIAMSDSKEALTACIFWLKCRANWSTLDGPEVQVNVQNNSVIQSDDGEIKEFKKRWNAIDV